MKDLSSLPCSRALTLRLGFALSLVACADDLARDTTTTESTRVLTDAGEGDFFTTRVDASDAASWVYFSFEAGAEVVPDDAQSSAAWDLGFQRFHIISNGGVSGRGGAAVAVIAGADLASVLEAPVEGYLEDQPDSDDDDTVADSAFAEGGGWYDYDNATNRLSARALVYVVRTPVGAHYELAFVDYYDAAGTSGHPSFVWAELER